MFPSRSFSASRCCSIRNSTTSERCSPSRGASFLGSGLSPSTDSCSGTSPVEAIVHLAPDSGFGVGHMKELLAGIDGRMIGKALRHPLRAVLRLGLRARLARTRVEEERARLHTFLSQQF